MDAKLDAYLEFTREVADYEGAMTLKGTDYSFKGLVSELGELAGVLKRVIRDDKSNFMSLTRRAKAVDEAGDILWYFVRLLDDAAGITLEEIIRHNTEKLSSRKERGVIHGEGGSR